MNACNSQTAAGSPILPSFPSMSRSTAPICSCLLISCIFNWAVYFKKINRGFSCTLIIKRGPLLAINSFCFPFISNYIFSMSTVINTEGFFWALIIRLNCSHGNTWDVFFFLLLFHVSICLHLFSCLNCLCAAFLSIWSSLLVYFLSVHLSACQFIWLSLAYCNSENGRSCADIVGMFMLCCPVTLYAHCELLVKQFALMGYKLEGVSINHLLLSCHSYYLSCPYVVPVTVLHNYSTIHIYHVLYNIQLH